MKTEETPKTTKPERKKRSKMPVAASQPVEGDKDTPQPAKAPPAPKQLANNAVRKLKAKLEALCAAPGTPDEGNAAKAKLDRLLARFDFGQADVSKDEIFSGRFDPAPVGTTIGVVQDWQVASAIKWAIEQATRIQCGFDGNVITARASSKTALKLAGIVSTIDGAFAELWARFKTFPTIQDGDKAVFIRGLYDGMMGEVIRDNLPRRIPVKQKRAKGRSVGFAAGLVAHPYTIAVDLGKSIRFQTPLPEVINQLETMKPKEITQ